MCIPRFSSSRPVSNLKKILESVFEYYGDVLNISLNEFTRPNAMRLAEKNDQNELGRLIQLILGKYPLISIESWIVAFIE